jgi:hypothetical protein
MINTVLMKIVFSNTQQTKNRTIINIFILLFVLGDNNK